MFDLICTLVIAQAQPANPPPPLTDVLPPPGMYAIYRNGVGKPLYFYVPDDTQRQAGNRMQVFDKASVDFIADQLKIPHLNEVVIPDTDLPTPYVNGTPVKGPSFLQRLGSGMRAAGQSLRPTGGVYSSGSSFQTQPMIPPAPMQFTPMQRPMTISPGVNTMNGPTYTIWP